MNKKEYIKNLFDRYKEGSLSPSEYQELSSFISEGDENEKLVDLLSENWRASVNDIQDIPTYNMLGKIKQQIENTAQNKDEKLEVSIISRLYPLLKYAAIFVISLGIGWIIRGMINQEEKAYIGVPNSLANNEITVSYGSKTRVNLPDGSVVNLNSGSILRYPAKFDSVNRKVYIEGEAFFDVKKDPANPFFVETKDITIRVLGTKFNVKAYNDEKIVQTVLVSGLIEIYSNKKEIKDKNKLLVLEPNQQAIFQRKDESIALSNTKKATDKSKSDLAVSVSKEVDVNTAIAWKENMLVFRDEKFADIAVKMERWYDVNIEIEDKDLSNVLFSGTFEKESVEQALNALRVATPFRYHMKKNHIVISKININN